MDLFRIATDLFSQVSKEKGSFQSKVRVSEPGPVTELALALEVPYVLVRYAVSPKIKRWIRF
jgi:hypothetical protein